MTKKRLYAFLQYEWIKIIGAIAAIIFVLYVVFSTLGGEMRKLDAGQRYYFTYSTNIDDSCVDEMNRLVYASVSKDVRYKSVYRFTSDGYSEQQISAYSMSGELDAMIFDDTVLEKDYPEYTRFTYCVDGHKVWDFDSLYASAKSYVETFFNNGATELTADNISDEKIKISFEKKAKNDGRYKTAAQKEEGLANEKARVTSLIDAVNDLGRLLAEHPEIFRTYTRYTASYSVGKAEQSQVDAETEKKYGIDLSKLTVSEGKTGIEKYATIAGTSSAEGTVFMIFDMRDLQSENEYESLTLLSALVRKTTNFLD